MKSKKRRGMKQNRRDKKLDALIGKEVQIVFWDGDIKEGVLEWNRQYWGLVFGSNKYSITDKKGIPLFFRKSHVKKIKEVKQHGNISDYHCNDMCDLDSSCIDKQ